MEDIKAILNSIKKHTDVEADKGVLNRSVGRSSVNIERQGNRTIWITNTTIKSNFDHYTDRVGNVHSVSRQTTHTYMEMGQRYAKIQLGVEY